MGKIKGQYKFNKGSWFVRYKVEDGDEQHFEEVMLYPSQWRLAVAEKRDLFIIKDCPNFLKEGKMEPMAILDIDDYLDDVAEKLKGQDTFKRLNEHFMSALQESGLITEPNKGLLKAINFSDESILSNGLRFTFDRVSEKGSLSAEDFNRTKSTFMHVAKWIRDNWEDADEDFLGGYEASGE